MKTTRTNLFKIGVGAFLSFSLLLVSTAAASAPKCSAIFAYQVSPMTKEQINRAILELSALRLNLDKGQAQGARSITLNFLQKDFDLKYAALSVYVEKNQLMTRAELLERLQQEIARLQQEPLKKEIDESPLKASQIKQLQQIEDRHKGYKMTPQKVAAGIFIKLPRGEQIVIEKPFEMMSTTTTQIVWRKVVELLNTNFHGEYDLLLDPSLYKSELHPVESVSFNDVEFWLWGLNQLSQKGEPALADIIEGHQAGDHYRLPRENEWDYVLHGQERVEIEREIDQYAWYNKLVGGNPRPVGLKQPILKDGKDFYDLLGNVNELMDEHMDSGLGPAMNQHIRPQRDPRYLAISTRGGNFGQEGSQLFVSDPMTRISKRSYVGFRMVRDVRVPSQVQQQISQQPQMPVPVQIQQPVSQQAPVQAAPPAAPKKTSLWKKITGKLGW